MIKTNSVRANSSLKSLLRKSQLRNAINSRTCDLVTHCPVRNMIYTCDLLNSPRGGAKRFINPVHNCLGARGVKTGLRRALSGAVRYALIVTGSPCSAIKPRARQFRQFTWRSTSRLTNRRETPRLLFFTRRKKQKILWGPRLRHAPRIP